MRITQSAIAYATRKVTKESHESLPHADVSPPQFRECSVMRMPWRGRSVTSGSGTTSWPGTSCNRNFCASALITMAASISANPWPMQRRGPSPNGKYAPAGRRLHQAVEPALGAIGIGIVEEARIAMRHPRREQDRRAQRNIVAADLARLDRHARENVRRRVEPERFVHHGLQVGQALQVGHFRRTPAEHAVQFLVKARFDRGILAERVPRPR